MDRRTLVKGMAALGLSFPVMAEIADAESPSTEEIAELTALCELGYLRGDGAFVPVRFGYSRCKELVVGNAAVSWLGTDVHTGFQGAGVVSHQRITMPHALIPPMIVALGSSSVVVDGLEVAISQPRFTITTA